MSTIIGFAILSAVIVLVSLRKEKHVYQNLVIRITSSGQKQNDLFKFIVEVLKRKCQQIELKRLEEMNDLTEASFFVEIKEFGHLSEIKEEISKEYSEVRVSFIENK